jgi:hypothetical protein
MSEAGQFLLFKGFRRPHRLTPASDALESNRPRYFHAVSSLLRDRAALLALCILISNIPTTVYNLHFRDHGITEFGTA